jgi:hypothetical protein
MRAMTAAVPLVFGTMRKVGNGPEGAGLAGAALLAAADLRLVAVATQSKIIDCHLAIVISPFSVLTLLKLKDYGAECQ